MNYRPTVAEIHLERLEHNCKLLMALNPANSFFCPMVKANAYGHGAVAVTKCLQSIGVENVGVALIEEAIELREQNISQMNILVFGTFFSAGAQAFKKYGLTPVVTSWEELSYLEAIMSDREAYPVHLKINSGMNRLGFPVSQAENLGVYFRGQNKLKLSGVCTHLSDGEDAHLQKGRSQFQLQLFKNLLSHFDLEAVQLHALNSSGLIALHCAKNTQWLKSFPLGSRPGISLYGDKPILKTPDKKVMTRWEKIQLQPVMKLKTQITGLRRLRPGERLSYGGTWTAPQEALIGILPIGYEDGFHRQLSNHGKIGFRGKTVNVRGTVCMDYTMIDLTPFSGKKEPSVGEPIEVFGDLPRVGEVAAQAGTISYELLTSVGSRVPRNFMGD